MVMEVNHSSPTRVTGNHSSVSRQNQIKSGIIRGESRSANIKHRLTRIDTDSESHGFWHTQRDNAVPHSHQGSTDHLVSPSATRW